MGAGFSGPCRSPLVLDGFAYTPTAQSSGVPFARSESLPGRCRLWTTCGVDEEDLRVPPIADPRPGQLLYVKGRPLPFSMWPVGRGIRRYGLSDYLFAKSPWAVVRGAIESHAPTARVREASAFLDQAQSFFDAAQSREPSFTPLLFYYSFMNLAKAFILAKGLATSLDRARHGLMDGRGPGTTELDAAQVVVKNPSSDINIFPLLARALESG